MSALGGRNAGFVAGRILVLHPFTDPWEFSPAGSLRFMALKAQAGEEGCGPLHSYVEEQAKGGMRAVKGRGESTAVWVESSIERRQPLGSGCYIHE